MIMCLLLLSVGRRNPSAKKKRRKEGSRCNIIAVDDCSSSTIEERLHFLDEILCIVAVQYWNTYFI
jgi:hypothetical protein